MNEIESFLLKVDKSFFLSVKEQIEFKRFMLSKKWGYETNDLKYLLDEKNFIVNFLKSLLKDNSKDISYIEIYSKMKKTYLDKIKELEKKENAEDLENILANI